MSNTEIQSSQNKLTIDFVARYDGVTTAPTVVYDVEVRTSIPELAIIGLRHHYSTRGATKVKVVYNNGLYIWVNGLVNGQFIIPEYRIVSIEVKSLDENRSKQ